MRFSEHIPGDLTNDQRRTSEALDDFLAGKDQVFLLKGYAGTGKTWLLGRLTAYLRQQGRRWC